MLLSPTLSSLPPIKGLSVKSIQDETPPPLGISPLIPITSILAPYSPEIRLGTPLGMTKVLPMSLLALNSCEISPLIYAACNCALVTLCGLSLLSTCAFKSALVRNAE